MKSVPLHRSPSKPAPDRLAALATQIDARLAEFGIDAAEAAQREEARKVLPGQALGLPARPRLLAKTLRSRLARWDAGVQSAVDLLQPLPGPGEILHAIMDGSFTGWQVAAALLDITGPWAQLYVATLSFNAENTANLLAAIDAGKIQRLLFACSEYFRETDGAIFESLRQQLTERGHRVFAARIHAKVIAAATQDGRHYVIESSANLRSCNAVEQFTLCASQKPVFDFHTAWLEEAFKRSVTPNH